MSGFSWFLQSTDSRSFSRGDGGLFPDLCDDTPLLRPWGPRLRAMDERLLAAADIWTSGAEMLPVLLDELKSASLPGFTRPDLDSFLWRVDWILPSPAIAIVHFFLIKSSSFLGQNATAIVPVSGGVFTGDTDWLLGQPVSSEQKLLLLIVRAERLELGLNSLLSSSEKGDSEVGDTFCGCRGRWGRRIKRGIRLLEISFS